MDLDLIALREWMKEVNVMPFNLNDAKEWDYAELFNRAVPMMVDRISDDELLAILHQMDEDNQ